MRNNGGQLRTASIGWQKPSLPRTFSLFTFVILPTFTVLTKMSTMVLEFRTNKCLCVCMCVERECGSELTSFGKFRLICLFKSGRLEATNAEIYMQEVQQFVFV